MWTILWIVVWSVFNLKIRWFLDKFNDERYIGRGVFFLISFFLTYILYSNLITSYIPQLLLAVILVNFIGVVLSLTPKFYAKFKKDRFFILFQTFNVLFQQTMVLVSILLLKNHLGYNYNNFYYGIWFFVMHIPILFAKWSRLRYLFLIYSLFGGLIFSFLFNSLSFGIIICFLIHFIVYIWSIYYIKTDKQI